MTEAATHFSEEAGGEPSAPGRYVHTEDLAAVEFLPGLAFRPVLGERGMANFVSFEPGVLAPRHVHEEEQFIVVLEGSLTVDLDGDVRVLRRGDVAVVPAWVPHAAWTGDDGGCLEVDFFVPPRQTLLDIAAQHLEG